MGKVIKKRIQGMHWLLKTSLVLLLTFATTVFMYKGWYQPQPAHAATVTYGPTIPDGGASVGIDGASDFPTAGGTVTTAPTVQCITGATPTTSGASYRPTTGMTQGTPVTLLKFYSPVYATAQTITAPSGSFAIRGYNATDTWTFNIYSYNPSGVAGNKTLMYSSDTTTSGTGSTVVVAPIYTQVNSAMPAGYRLMTEIVYTPGGTTYTPRVYLDGTANTSWCRFTVTETAASTGGTLAVSATTQSVSEAIGNATISVTRTGGSTGAVTVDYTTADGTALAGQDYTFTSGTLSWADGETTAKTITVPITNDTYDESNETFTVTLSNATNGATLGTATQTVTILDDDSTPTIGFATSTSTGNKYTTPAVFTVQLSAASGLATAVNYATANGTATAGTDYTTTSGTLNIPALSTSGTINVPILSSGSGGTFTITLTSPVNATLGTSPHTYTITSSPPATITNCGGCHGYPGGTNTTFDGTRGAGLFPGTHNTHVTTYGYACTQCHRDATANNHQNRRINMANGINGLANARYKNVTSFPVIDTAPTFGTCNSTKCHGQVSPTWAATASTTQCTKCHGQANYVYNTNYSSAQIAPGGSGRDTGGKTLATDARVGGHQNHLTATTALTDKIHCGECHSGTIPNSTTTSLNTHLNMTTAQLSWGSLAKTKSHNPTVTRTGGVLSCSATYCHTGNLNSGNAMTPAWNNTAYLNTTLTVTDCNQCHGLPPKKTPYNHVSSATTAYKITTYTQLSVCSGCHTSLKTSGITSWLGAFTDIKLHMNGSPDASSHSFPYPGGSPQHKIDAGTTWSSCTTCHTTTGTGTMTAYATWVAGGHTTATAPNCSVCHIGGLANNSCSQCHGVASDNGTSLAGMPVATGGAFPNISGSHRVHMTKVTSASCSSTNSCHSGFGSGSVKHGFGNTTTTTQNKVKTSRIALAGTFAVATYVPASNSCNNTCHGSGAVWGGRLKCIDCHASAQTRTKGRPGVVIQPVTGASGEFGLAWGHKKTGRGTVSDADCIVCHLEGNFTTQNKSAYHGDGNIDLRDPDGAGETPITNNSGGAFTFARYSVSYASTSRTTTLGNTIAEVVTVKFCMKCHDANGATNTTARSNNGGTGTQYSPWGGVSTGYTVINGAAAANGVIDVATQFASTNSSRHPVGAPNSRAYPYSTRLMAPYNNIGTSRDSNVLTGGGTGTRTKANSVILLCDDCHTTTTAANGAAVPTLTRRTITAHGTAQTENVRGTFMVTSPTLCLGCHGTAGTTANQTTSQIDTNTTSGGDHNSGSAFTTGTTRVASFMTQCQYCHFSAITKPARPIRAQDVHGFNGMQTTGAGWASGTVAGMRPVAFMRNVANWAAASPRPAVVLAEASGGTLGQIAVAAGQSTCAGTGDLSNGSCSGQTGKHLNYSPGGSY